MNYTIRNLGFFRRSSNRAITIENHTIDWQKELYLSLFIQLKGGGERKEDFGRGRRLHSYGQGVRKNNIIHDERRRESQMVAGE